MTTVSRRGTELFAGLPRERASLLSGLHRISHAEGYVSIEGLRLLANYIRVPAVEVQSAATTYSELRFAPVPPGLRRVCTGLACRLRGADDLLRRERESAAPVEEVACFFACGVGPVLEAGEPPRLAGRVEHSGVVPPAAALRSSQPQRNGTGRRTAILVGGGSCGRAVDADGVFDAIRAEAADLALDVVQTGCDGACWAQPTVKLRLANGATALLATNAVSDDAAHLAAAGVAVEVSPPAAYDEWLSGQERRLLGRCGTINPDSLEEYRFTGGYQAWERARGLMQPRDVHAVVADSGLLGRGGAYFPVARKWETAIGAPGDVYLVVNLEEGEPGVYKDRHLCEGDPHAVVEGMLLAAFALEAPRVYVYINGQADLSARRIGAAIEQARAAGLVPDGLAITVLRGAGGYVCGEESVILNSIEGQRAVPRLRPPFPAESGLWGHPTVVNNAETLASLPLILRHGAGWFRAVGTDAAPGTKLLCVSGAVARPGLIEVAFGTSLRAIVEQTAGAPPGRTVAVVTGGPSGGLIPTTLLDTPLRPGILDDAGAILGAGGMTVIDATLSPLEAVRQLTAYNAAESCGKCTPCREGTARTEAILAGIPGTELADGDRDHLDELNETVRLASLCGLGQAAPNPVTSYLRHFAQGRPA